MVLLRYGIFRQIKKKSLGKNVKIKKDQGANLGISDKLHEGSRTNEQDDPFGWISCSCSGGEEMWGNAAVGEEGWCSVQAIGSGVLGL